MIHEHAVTINSDISEQELEYIIKKANRIGLSGREITRWFFENDSDGKHLYFECEPLKDKGLID